jgi:hypothetical protein
MHSNLSSLPDILLNHLGAYSRLDILARLPQLVAADVKTEALRQSKNGEPYHVSVPQQGLSLMLQCMNPEALPETIRMWGLQGLTLQAGTWKGGWPTGLNPSDATAGDVVGLLAGNPDEIMNMPPMLCFTIQGAGGQAWSVMAVFDSASKKLSSFSLVRVGEWRKLQVTQP